MLSRRRALSCVLAYSVVFLASCFTPTASGPSEQPSPAAQSQAPSPTPLPPLRPARTIGVVGEGVAASGDFRGSGKSQIALLQDPARNSSVRITVRDPNGDGDTFAESVWLTTPANTFALLRAKIAVADVNFDGRDDLVALYDSGGHTSSLLVFKSTGTAFEGPSSWWKGEDYVWTRARNLLAGKFGANDRDSLLVTYQNDDADMRVHSFESTGTAFAFGGTQGVYDSGRGQFDASRARFAVGHFTRTGGAEQIAAFYQYPNAKVRLNIFDPSPNGLVLTSNVFESADNEYDLGRATISAADVTGDGKDDLISVYGQPDGSGAVHVFDSGSSFKPSNGYTGWASFPAASVCAGATGVVAGDWNSDRKVDVDALTPGDGIQIRTNLLRNMGGGFKLTSTAVETLCPRWPLTGMPLGTGSATKRPLYVKIDNNAHARPHYGISKADQVYEWLVEGLTTRLAAVFQSQDPGVIGSVRSARMTDTPVVPSLDAAFVYSGGGPIELMGLHYDSAVAHRYVDLSPSFGWGYRVGFREAPYNYFTTYEALRGALAAAEDGDQPAIVPSWDFLPPSATDPLVGGLTGSVAATAITIPYRAGFAVRYDYNPAARSYTRYDDGVREIDPANGEVVAARNIVVIQTEVHFTTEFGLDPAGSPKLDMQLTGTGHGSVFRDGKRQDVTWTRPDVSDVFRLTNASGEAVRLVPGQTWIHIVPADWSIPSQ